MINKVILIGNLGKDPESRTFPNGGQITTTSLATSERWKDKQTGEPREATEWHNLVFSDRLAEIAAQYLQKGSRIYVEGNIRTRKYNSNGEDRYITEIRVREMKMLTSKAESQALSQQNTPHQSALMPQQQQPQQQAPMQQAPQQMPQQQPQSASFDNFEDDIPF